MTFTLPYIQVREVLQCHEEPPWTPYGPGSTKYHQTWKMSRTLPEQDCSFPYFTRKCINFEIATKERNLGANTMFPTFTG